jgi:hypothetical protein
MLSATHAPQRLRDSSTTIARSAGIFQVRFYLFHPKPVIWYTMFCSRQSSRLSLLLRAIPHCSPPGGSPGLYLLFIALPLDSMPNYILSAKKVKDSARKV